MITETLTMATVDKGGELQGERKRKKRGGKYSSRLWRPGCFRVAATDPSPAKTGGEEDGEQRKPKPNHLVVTVNGLIGSARDWRYAAKHFVKRYPEDVVVHCSECNCARLTLDGIDVMGERLAKEVLSVVERRPELQKISFVGHSLGGLITRYAIALLFKPSVERSSSEETEAIKSVSECLEQDAKAKIAGLEPMNFITFVTPHLGSRWHKQIPILCGSPALERMSYKISSIVGKTGNHLFLKDKKDGKPPLLLQMVTDNGGIPFMSALQSFKRRVTYSNVCSDFIVGWRTSCIRFQHELPKRENFTKNEKYRHVVNEEKPKNLTEQHEGFLEIDFSQPINANKMEELMIKGLKRVPWERVDVSFRKSKQRILAHTTIQVNTYAINSAGADVIFHMIDNFLL
ncbi:E3 ubiquitin-protein ligase FANCL protein [Dioscorea alata]|uniref:E3 ubiquitin-protein ligase FANCL protein n=1 Tax=Dioscorea alata TaxID=55571 RepID=A0ACB7UW21_DIOAL|nr:E3 ubiquitin-protein ligase FANCL protein [Dioscorea alata]